ncbi:MAG: 2OG-Fe(II) oxygenase [Thalassobaculaceae bacterium]|nr:2OG-Fe(II) oxygenase [Thalassobaculaceae bacterium]
MSIPALRPGDRTPNLTFPDLKGRQRQLYLEVRGGPILVAATPNPNDGDGRKVLASLAKRAGALDKLGVHRFALMRREPDSSVDRGAVIMIDPYGDGMRLFRPLPEGSEDDADRPAAAVAALDANQRVISIFTTANSRDPVDDAIKVLEVEAKAAKAGAQRLVRAAPAMILDKLLPDALCDALIAAWKADNVEGTVNDGFKNVTDDTIKRNREHVVTDPEMQRTVAQQIGPRVMNEIQKVFNFRSPLRFEMLTVLGYGDDRKDFFAPHRDSLRSERRRRFAVSLNLNEGYVGGELTFPEYGPHLYAPPKGAGAVFGCEVLHEAKPVTKGQRWVLTTFLIDPK